MNNRVCCYYIYIYLFLYVARILGVEGVAVAVVDGVVIGAAVLLAVGGVLLAPRDRVERAGGAVRNAVLGQQVGVEEVLFRYQVFSYLCFF